MGARLAIVAGGGGKSLMSTAVTTTGLRKAAIFLVSIGEQASAEVLKRLGDEEVKAVSKAIVRLDNVPQEEVDAVLEEIYQNAFSQSGAARGGMHYARRILSNAFGPESARRIAEHLSKSGMESKEMEVLQKADPRQLVRFLEEEHPQTIAIILAHLSVQQAASLLASLPQATRADVVVRIAELEHVSPDVVARIAVIMTDRIRLLGEMKQEIGRGPRSVAEILNRMNSEEAESILADIQDQQSLVDAIRNFMFVFEDVLVIDSKVMKEVVAKIDRKILLVALKGAGDQIKDHFLGGMSQRAREMISEDMEALGPVKIKDVKGAQQQIVAVIRQLEAEGLLNLKGGTEEEYVV
jgi:flagellar motor switch protein FliG